MHDPKLGPDSKAAVLRAMQRLALEQSAENSGNRTGQLSLRIDF